MSNLDYEINKELGECYLFMGDLEKAEQYYMKAATSSDTLPDPYLGLATVAVQKGELEKALTLYKKAEKIESNDKALAGMALIEMETGMEAEAFDHLSAALGQNQENLVALFSLVRLGHSLDRLAEVIPHLENYLELDPEKHEIRYSLAGCLICLDDKARAVTHLKQILDTDPENESAKELYAQVS